MGTIAEKLTYLNTTKEKIKDSINLTGANLTSEDTFRSYATKLKLGYIDIINNGTDNLYNNFPKVSGIGSNLSLTPTYEAPIKLNEIQGNTLQNGSPTPSSPVPIQSVTGRQEVNVCGKNLFGLNVESNTILNITRNVSNGKIILDGTTDGSGDIYNDNTNIITFPAGTYTFSSKILNGSFTRNNKDIAIYLRKPNNESLFEIAGSLNYTRNTTVTLNEDTNIHLQIYTNDSGFVADNLEIGLQIEKGTQATSYEPYTGNTYEVNLGKNLLDYSTMQYGYCNNIGTITTTHEQGEMYSKFIKVKPNTTYTFKIFETSSSYDNWIGISEYTSNNLSNFIQRITMTTTTQNYYTFTTSATTQYVILSARNLEQATKVQFELGEATSYSPYFTPIELNKIGDYKDRIYKDSGKWYLYKEFGKAIFDNITWDSAGHQASGYRRYYTNTIPNVKYVSSNTELGVGLAEKYSIHKGQGMGSYGAENCFAIDVSIVQAVDTQTPTGYLIYLLATPTTEEITNTELINQLEALYTAKSQEGTTNISITSEDLEMILNVSALKGEE